MVLRREFGRGGLRQSHFRGRTGQLAAHKNPEPAPVDKAPKQDSFETPTFEEGSTTQNQEITPEVKDDAGAHTIDAPFAGETTGRTEAHTTQDTKASRRSPLGEAELLLKATDAICACRESRGERLHMQGDAPIPLAAKEKRERFFIGSDESLPGGKAWVSEEEDMKEIDPLAGESLDITFEPDLLFRNLDLEKQIDRLFFCTRVVCLDGVICQWMSRF